MATIIGTDSNNILNGTASSDTIIGRAGNDQLFGNGGNDRLNGGTGNDLLNGGAGTDTLNGDVGNDLFDYNAVAESPVGAGRDKINGFSGNGALAGDRIDLTTIDANVLLFGNQAFSWIGGNSFTAARQLRYVGGVLQGNTDGDAAAEFEIQLVGVPSLFVQAGHSGSDILL